MLGRWQVLRILGFVLAMTALAACQTVKSNVTTFHTLSPAVAQTFSVASGPGIEGSTYAALISSKLTAKGWSQSPNAEVRVRFDYGVDGGRTVLGSVPVYGQTGGGSTFHSGTVYGRSGSASFSGTSYTAPTFGVVGSAPASEVIYTRTLRVTMTKAGKSVFEGNVVSAGSNSTFAAVAPCMIDALFKDFPGTSGKARTVEVDASKCD